MSSQRQCEFPNCGRPHRGRGWCASHLDQYRRTGNLRPIRQTGHGQPIEQRLEANSRPEGGCLLWDRACDTNGYGRIYLDGRLQSVHRVAWALAHGAIPDGKVLNHICGNRSCLRVSHLELVTQRQNVQYRTVLNLNNSSGFRGVGFHRHTGRWRARVTLNQREVYLGLFDTREAAAEAARIAREQLHSLPDFTARVRNLTKGA